MAQATLKDPLGRQVTLAEHTWHGHILIGHPDMQQYRSGVELAVTDPLEIRTSQADPNCRIYFGVQSKPGTIIAVLTDINGGFIKTALNAQSAKGTVEWSRPMR